MKKKLNAYVEENLFENFKKTAQEQGFTMNKVIEILVAGYVKDNIKISINVDIDSEK